MNISGMNGVGPASYAYNNYLTSNYLAGSNYLSGANYLNGVNYLAGANYLNGVDYLAGQNYLNGVNYLVGGDYLGTGYVTPYINSNAVSFQKALENILNDYVKKDADGESSTEMASATEEKTQEQKLQELLDQIENESKQNQHLQTDTSWWELRSERSESLKEQSEQYFLKTQEERKWDRQQARKQERETLKAEYRQAWKYL